MKIQENKKITLKRAVDFSILKWESIIKYNGEPYHYTNEHPELADLKNGCGLCEKFLDTNKETCGGCPLAQIQEQTDYQWCGCERSGHPYLKWRHESSHENHEESISTAKEILKLIKEIKWD